MSETVKTGLDALVASAANPSEPVKLSGGEVAIRGVSILEFIGVLRQFPRIRNTILSMIGAAGATDEDETDSARSLAEIVLDFGPEAVAALVATGMGRKGDQAAIDAVLNLGDEDLILLLGAVIERTMPDKLPGFFARFHVLAEKMGLRVVPEGQAAP